MIISTADMIIDKAPEDGMKDKTYYKDIYILVKERVNTFAGLQKKTEILDKQMAEIKAL